MDAYRPVLSAEAYAYHKEYDAKSPGLYQTPTLARIRAGEAITLSAYIQDRRQIEQIRHAVTRVFHNVDIVITPTMRIPPLAIAELAARIRRGRRNS